MSLYVKQLLLGPMQNFIHLFGAEGRREAAVVDPAWDVDAICAAAEKDGKELIAAFLTHHHHDHINGLAPLLERRPGIRVYAQAAEIEFSPELQAFGQRIEGVAPGETIRVGELEVGCIHTPGHTPGSHCLLARGSLFTGDTLFVCGCGRCDLPGGDPEAMFDSLHRKLAALPDETVVYPGHDYGEKPVSTLGDEKRENPFYRHHDPASFVAFRMRPRR